MNISAKIAQKIVLAMKDILHHDLNYMDKDGMIVASTDSKRVGTFHGGARYVLQSQQDLIIECDQQYAGTQKGINIPIHFNSEIIGVIGITGDRDEVIKYGEVLRKMTEILIKEEYLNNLSFEKRERNRLLLTSILSAKKGDSSEFMDFSADLARFAVVGKLPTGNKSKESLYEVLFDYLQSDNQDILYYIFDDEIFILFQEESDASVLATLEQMNAYMQRKLDQKLVFGIGSRCQSIPSIQDSFKKAQSALNWSLHFSDKPIQRYEDLTLGILFSSPQDKQIKEFHSKILSQIPNKELLEFKELVDIYGENNRSINKCAEKLFIHKNTLQYRIAKLEEYTGYDLRNINDYVILKLAFVIDCLVN